MSILKSYKNSLKTEFKGYNGKKFGQDVLAGVTVAAVALPLALAFGVSSGASAAAGLITAILAGVIIGVLSGASYQISGPTGAMTAILVTLVAVYGMEGMFVACFISGAFLLIAGLFKLGSLVSLIPLPVITGFTSGIAIIIAYGQLGNISGLVCEGETTIQKTISYFTIPQNINLTALIIGVGVIILMAVYPKKLAKYLPSSLAAIIITTALNFIFEFDAPAVGEIPKTLFLPEKLELSGINFDMILSLLSPAFSIAALGLIESLLCGASAGRMKNEPIVSDRELLSQGIGNMIIPFFGGVPATAAIARTSVAIKSGGQTRITGVVHSIVLLLSMFVLGSVMSKIPLAALAGVLMVTAFRMNEWDVIKNIFGKKIKTAMFQFLITMLATVIFDLTIAILIGIFFSLIMFVLKVSKLEINVSEVDSEKMHLSEIDAIKHKNTSVVYVTGPLYFGTAGQLVSKIDELTDKDTIILSMRGVTMADSSGVEVLNELCNKLSEKNIAVYFTAVQPKVMEMFDRCGASTNIGKSKFYWSTDKALNEI